MTLTLFFAPRCVSILVYKASQVTMMYLGNIKSAWSDPINLKDNTFSLVRLV